MRGNLSPSVEAPQRITQFWLDSLSAGEIALPWLIALIPVVRQ